MLLRHAKALWAEDGSDDRERALSGRGRRDAETLMPIIAREHCPDRILCSPARRTRETLAALLPYIAEVSDISIADDLYEHPGDYTDVIARLGGDADRLMVIGHNPAIQATAVALAGSGDPALRAQLRMKFPTCALAVVEVPDRWSALEPLAGRLVAFRRARDLDDDGD
jgi:phosphohistidine phosphatase